MNAEVKEEKPFSSTLYTNIPPASTLGRIQLITSEQGNSSDRMDTFAIPDLNMFPNKDKYSKPVSGTF